MEGFLSFLFFAAIFYLVMRFGRVAFDLAFPEIAMYEVWLKLLPGFEWITWKSFLLGLVESYAYGWYFALVWVPLYNVFARRGDAGWRAVGPERGPGR